ncbi:MAG: pyridoxamine 5'-phosphate oxidase family protein [Phenylobacterium sp.]|uniref:MSMEG_1061 family FMN-dependent PPOX-type flavoprotein n=1 Tax=Phenylobacterium sp. TaxID=1871053 RepID=UPI001B659A26|nr:MSMEG_1061 family FMN-dependent PPOX-type flavoprotein [Phenylobacterium sp.]MBP7651141.1 pyridoxamine 5'-phosphate oxidase family protein [Phenylobacterium sp.]MBP7817185.1 pyridoxamine 5'-phosphate oxidase family protein [Phenylobacterium sp.]MBP9230274.1 pyridoxamine 5'-phosphate oxidase family protein [Phenylobacterium sp.]MBP9755168.1 pyridoxamine 5'-phosphate oxidase family protein [Phenylobacterium sp.]
MKPFELADLDQIYRQPGKLVIDKALAVVDKHGKSFIALSPFCVVSSAGPDGSMDVSPRGGEPGFVHVSEDGLTLFLPDRPGNNRLDTIRNLLAGPGRIGLMFMIPGFDDVYRVNGRASASADPELLDQFVEFGKAPRLVLAVAVDEAFFHCPKAIMRARLWDAEAQVERSALPTLAEVIFDQLNMGKAPVSEDVILAGYKTQL